VSTSLPCPGSACRADPQAILLLAVNNVDPFFSAAAKHFDGLLEKYGGPLIVLNLVKVSPAHREGGHADDMRQLRCVLIRSQSIESTPRESKLLHEFTQCVTYLNQLLPADKQLVYIPWDMSRANKSPNQDTIKIMDEVSLSVSPGRTLAHVTVSLSL
jgi:hypothetical protein